MVSASIRNTGRIFLGSLSVYTAAMNTQEPALGWPSVSESWIGIMDGSGSNPNPDEDQRSASPSPSDKASVGTHFHVLIVDDNESDVFLIQEAIGSTRLQLTLHIAKDGEQAIRFFDRADAHPEMPCPSLVILDINLPKKQGGEVLKHMRQSRKCANALVLVVSTSDSAKDREQMTNLGADGYFRKPSQYDEFMKLGDIVKGLLGGPAPLSKSADRTQ
jgi:chemotaxis family two-component system response regulator Rcp1